MTKTEMMQRLDNMMLVCLNSAIDDEQRGWEFSPKVSMGDAGGVLLSANALGLLNEDEFANINACLSYSSIGKGGRL